MKAKRIIILVIMLSLFFFPTYSSLAQDEAYKVHVRKNFGYNWGNDIQGRFRISLVGYEGNVKKATFYVDTLALGSVEDAPFEVQFNTDDFEDGSHQLFAVVYLKDGSELTTPPLSYDFLNPQDARQQVTTLLIWIGVAIIGTLLVVGLIQMVMLRGKGKPTREIGEPRHYGLMGGTICPNCGRPFPRHIWGINLLVGRLDRCENCGKWVMTTRASTQALQDAEQAELEIFQSDAKTSAGKPKLEDQYEETKYFDDF